MKRIGLVLSILIMLVFSASCDSSCDHIWSAATCTKAASCEKCNETDGAPLGHNYSPATCTNAAFCSRCNETDGEPLGHNYSPATCTNAAVCQRCNKTDGEPLGHNYSPATYQTPATCQRCYEQYGEPLTPASQWGFYNLSEMGFGLVRINEYNLTDKDNAYVVATGMTYQFENGYRFDRNFTVENNQCVFSTAKSPGTYTIVNNDNLLASRGWNIEIEERFTVKSRENFVVFADYNAGNWGDLEIWYIPYSLIDWDRGAEVSPEYSNEYILYLVP